MAAPTPAAGGYSMPAEWAPHERTLVVWPARRSLWGADLASARAAYAAAIRAVARFEPVTVVANVGAGPDAAATLGPTPGVEVVEEPVDDSWVRDTGPLVVTDASGRRRAVDFRFNGWGERYRPYDADAGLAARLAERLGLPRDPAPLVLEGGAITVDGAGTLVTTEQCLLNPNRNPGRSRAEVDAVLHEWLGVERVVWLAAGLVEDRDTDGHVDNVCAFVAPGVALVQGTADRHSADAPILDDARRRLERAGIAVSVVDVLPVVDVDDRAVAIPPLNFYQCNDGGVVVPVAEGDPAARDAAVGAIAALLPDRRVVGVPGTALARGGGGVHCITQQVPAGSAARPGT
ncbi:MAG TPA: agmatine deiminase family protein [Acidimicrobiia bacterium]|nr:agmatine deiminase family protein [Acidimicrobiia bacterium]